MKNVFLSIIFCSCLVTISFAQDKKMDQSVYDIWNRITNNQISADGQWLKYNAEPEDADQHLYLYNTESDKTYHFERAQRASFDANSNILVYKLVPAKYLVDSLKLAKVKKDNMPKDSLVIVNLSSMVSDTIANVSNFKIPEHGGSYVAYKMEKRDIKKDTTLVKKEGSENGTRLFVYDHSKDSTLNYEYVKNYLWSEYNNNLLIHTTGMDTINENSVDIVNLQDYGLTNVISAEGDYYKFTFDEKGEQLAFVLDQDTTKIKNRPYQLHLWQKGSDTEIVADTSSQFLAKDWQIAHSKSLVFSDNGSRLYFQMRPKPLEKDTTILDEDKAVVEIWNYKDDMLYTQQNVRKKRESERGYSVLYDIDNKKHISLGSEDMPEVMYRTYHTGNKILKYADKHYQKTITWLGYANKDVYLTDLSSGESELIAKNIQGSPSFAYGEKYVVWYSRPDTSWVSYSVANKTTVTLTKGHFYDETNDRPMHPYGSGRVDWCEDGEHMFIYDQYDIWKIRLDGTAEAENLTNGREDKIRHRYIRIDRELNALPADTTIMVKVFNESDKSSGYAALDLFTGEKVNILQGPFDYSTQVQQSDDGELFMFTKQSFQQFPDLILADAEFKNQKQISDVNPQQKEYSWGTIEIFKWQSEEGIEREGLLVKPDNFDPNKKYPLIVNFYEKSSDGLHRHRAPYPHRSTINYSYWVNKGYVIFNPDVHYKNGYPGRSCEEAVIVGTKALLEEGFIDESRMGLQGHSWGGYQIAHLLTKTNMFACAEAGAPVVNMISAYGGIRWGSGMSRMFQYERTQSRLGATLWENPELYIENSPVFNLDKVNTPVLILHNDEDGAVPWYQGIEYFVGLRRLGKPAWMLNYNEEPHWPVKRPNRLDFNKRLEQFFDHYLMDQAMPQWMERGVPAVEKGYNYGFELINDKK